jgi:hypothetical protein
LARPSKYRPEFAEQAESLCKLGATDADLAAFFKVDERSINNWKDAHPEFLQSLKDAKTFSDERVERSLFERANGYSHPAIKIAVNASGDVTQVPFVEHYPPDTTAAIFWLKNRRPDRWRDVTRNEITGADGAELHLAGHEAAAKVAAILAVIKARVDEG